MKSAILATLALASTAIASVHDAHMRFHSPRNVLAIEERNAPESMCVSYTTYTTYFYAEATYVPPPSSAAPAVTATVTPVAAAAAPVASSSAPAAPAAPAAPKTGGLPSGAAGAGLWAMTYTPYDSNGNCKSAGAVMSDMQTVKSKGFSTVRQYATDCNGLQNVGAGCKAAGLNMILGVYIGNGGISAAQPQVQEIISWANGDWSGIELIVVGNEAVFNEFCDASELASFIQSAKSAFQAAGYTGPVTTTEPLGTIQQNSGALCSVMDVPASNIQAFFNSGVSPSDAGSFVASQLDILCSLCGSSSGTCLNLESGWPNGGSNNGAAVPGFAEQAIALASIVSTAGSHSAMFSFENDPWKGAGEYGVEPYWGCIDNLPGA